MLSCKALSNAFNVLACRWIVYSSLAIRLSYSACCLSIDFGITGLLPVLIGLVGREWLQVAAKFLSVMDERYWCMDPYG